MVLFLFWLPSQTKCTSISWWSMYQKHFQKLFGITEKANNHFLLYYLRFFPTKCSELLVILKELEYVIVTSSHKISFAILLILPSKFVILDQQRNSLKVNKFIFESVTNIILPGEPNVSYICSRYYRAPELIFSAE